MWLTLMLTVVMINPVPEKYMIDYAYSTFSNMAYVAVDG